MLYKRVECAHPRGLTLQVAGFWTCPECTGTGYTHVHACDGEHHEWVYDARLLPSSDGVPVYAALNRHCANCGAAPEREGAP